jgi:putative ABC transport system substrate-binding protein
MAAELVKLKVDLIIVSATPPALAARQATTTIPIIAVSFGDPVRSGLAESLAHPGGNVTGFSNLSGDLEEKRLELLISVVPKASRIAQLVNPDNPSTMRRIPGLKAAAQKTGREFFAVEVRAANELEGVFSRLIRERMGALMVPNETTIAEQAPRIAELASRHRIPAIFGTDRGVEAGGLMSYAPDRGDVFRRVAVMVDKIFRGAKPGDLPIEQPTKLEFVINLKAAKGLGINIPQEILLRADKVIE